ncbi:MAG TPA: DUF5916 domain-containing protein, partial [Candidatus Eisenbacteria bacterium]|nr:DUF5916 domain-containing protein [Candidatus Eisenbacteria bacterium]
AALALVLAAPFAPRPAAAAAPPRASVPATRLEGELRVDGALDEPAWSRAPAIGDFRLLAPREGQAPDESTCVRVLYDGDRVVFGVWCQTRRPLRASLVPRDQITDGDFVAIHLDPDGDGQRAYIFGVNPYNVQLDGILVNDPDFKWDGVWESATQRGPDAWTAEIAVPFRLLRLPARPARPWRVWVRREITAWNEVSSWPLYRAGEAGLIMLQAADLTGLEAARGGRPLVVEPYAFGALTGAREPAAAGGLAPWSTGNRHQAGVDVQLAPTSTLALNATLNPDFSQIEADALQIDLNQRFPLQFPEKRPFFLEGAENFATPLELVYTRRIADPQWGAKLAGRPGGWTTGAVFVRDRGGAALAGSGFGSSEDAWPGYFALARVQRPFGNGSNVGLLAGAHAQGDEGPGAGPGPGGADSSATNHVEGADAFLRFSDRWTLESQLAYSGTRRRRARGAGAAADTAFGGAIGSARLDYRDPARSVELGYRRVDPHYRDELGYQDRVGVDDDHAFASWDLFPRAGAFQRITPALDARVLHDVSSRPELADVNPYLELRSRQNLFTSVGFHALEEHWLNRNYSEQRAQLYFEDTRWRPLTWDLSATLGDGIFYGDADATSYLAWTETWALDATVRPTAGVTSALQVQRLRVAR